LRSDQNLFLNTNPGSDPLRFCATQRGGNQLRPFEAGVSLLTLLYNSGLTAKTVYEAIAL